MVYKYRAKLLEMQKSIRYTKVSECLKMNMRL